MTHKYTLSSDDVSQEVLLDAIAVTLAGIITFAITYGLAWCISKLFDKTFELLTGTKTSSSSSSKKTPEEEKVPEVDKKEADQLFKILKSMNNDQLASLASKCNIDIAKLKYEYMLMLAYKQADLKELRPVLKPVISWKPSDITVGDNYTKGAMAVMSTIDKLEDGELGDLMESDDYEGHPLYTLPDYKVSSTTKSVGKIIRVYPNLKPTPLKSKQDIDLVQSVFNFVNEVKPSLEAEMNKYWEDYEKKLTKVAYHYFLEEGYIDEGEATEDDFEYDEGNYSAVLGQQSGFAAERMVDNMRAAYGVVCTKKTVNKIVISLMRGIKDVVKEEVAKKKAK